MSTNNNAFRSKHLQQGPIPFNPDALIEFNSLAEITARPRYIEGIEGLSDDLRITEAIGFYNFSDRVHCGLSSGHSPHAHGLVVAVSDAGKTYEMRIGCDCGATFFGDAVRVLWNQVKAVRRHRSALKQAQDAIALAQANFDRAERMWTEPKGGAWLAKFRVTFQRETPPIVRAWLTRVIRGESPRVCEQVPLTERERELRAISGTGAAGSAYKDVEVGVAKGADAWKVYIDQLLRVEIRNWLYELKNRDAEQMTLPELQKVVKTAASLDSQFSLALKTIQAGREFFTPENFELLWRVIPPGIERRSMQQVRWDFDRAEVRKKAA